MRNLPSEFETPRSPAQATVFALVGAAAILVTLVLPAEYGIDPTGIGRITGLKAMGDDKVAAAKAAQGHSAAPAATPSKPGDVPFDTQSTRTPRTDVLDVSLAPNSEIEYKAILGEGEAMVYEWDAGGAEVRFDFHGEPAGAPAGMFMTYRKGIASRGAGSLRAPFAGTHGWYWKNPGSQPVVIKLRVTGFHSELKRL